MSPPKPAEAERLRSLNSLLEVGLSLPADQRAAWQAALPPQHQALIAPLKALLARAEVDTDDFLQEPLALTQDDADDASPAILEPGDRIGPYRLVHELGAGGMASVWLAEREDGARRSVALKLPHMGWSAGIDRRVARERDILAGLEHPNIARLYEAGVTPEARPWLAMEYVQGQPLDVHCREQRLDVRQRLALFLQVADAVVCAHSRLVVHRDLKPNNILVTAQGDVRLLDFGVAKLLQDDEGSAQLTRALGCAVTPDYAAPEQVAGQEVTLATDVYALGIVLYELLTGQRPYSMSGVPLSGLHQALQTANVPLASSRVGADAGLARQLRGDLDTILSKALRKTPAHRYASVEALASDLRRHLAGEPVLAQAPHWRYRAGKFLLRHRLGALAGLAVTASLLAGLGLALWQAGQAREQAERAEQVTRFIASIFKQAVPRQGVGGAVSAVDLLTTAGQRLETELSANPRVAAELGVIIGESLSAMGEPNLGLAPLRKAVERAEAELGPRHITTLRGKLLLVESLNYSDMAASESLLTTLVPDLLASLPVAAEESVEALRQQSFVLANRGRQPEAVDAAQRAVAVAEQHLGRLHEETVYSLGFLSNTFGHFGDSKPQLVAASEAMQRAEGGLTQRRPHSKLTAVERWYGDALRTAEQPADAEPVLRRVLQDQRQLMGPESVPTRNAMQRLALALYARGKLPEADALMQQAIALVEQRQGEQTRDHAYFLLQRGRLLTTARRLAEAEALDLRGLQALAQSESDPSGRNASLHELRAIRRLVLQGRETAAREALDKAIAAAPTQPADWQAEVWISAALHERLQGRPAAAVQHTQRAVAAAGEALPRAQAAALAEEALAWVDQGDWARGQQALDRCLAQFRRAQVLPSIWMDSALIAESRLHLHKGQAEAARDTLQPLVAAWAAINPGSPWHGQALHWLAQAEAAAGHAQAAAALGGQAAPMLQRTDVPTLRVLSGSIR